MWSAEWTKYNSRHRRYFKAGYQNGNLHLLTYNKPKDYGFMAL